MAFCFVRVIAWLIVYFILVNFVHISPAVSGDNSEERIMSVVLDNTLAYNNYVHLTRPPKVLRQGAMLQVDYFCSVVSRVGVEVRVWTELSANVTIFVHTWTCDTVSRATRRYVKLNLPNNIAFRPSPLAPRSVLVKNAVLQGWLLEETRWRQCRRSKSCYTHSVARMLHTVLVQAPYERPDAKLNGCSSWPLSIRLLLPYTPQCLKQPEVHSVLSFPIVVTGHFSGLHTLPAEYSEKALRHEHVIRFTISTWIYIVEYCTMSGYDLCSILQRLRWDDQYLTPLLYINRQGFLHSQVMKEDDTPIAFLSTFPMPRHQWCRLVYTFHGNTWNITVNCERDWNNTLQTNYWLPYDVHLKYDDREGQTVFGGSELCPSFKGYIGKTNIYRRQILHPDNIALPAADDPMYQLRLTEHSQHCDVFTSWLTEQADQYTYKWLQILHRHSCANRFQDVLRILLQRTNNKCQALSSNSRRKRRTVTRIVRKWMLQGRRFDGISIGEILYKKAIKFVERYGLRVVKKKIVPLLKQSSCLGFHESTHLLSVIFSNGVGVSVNEILAYAYLMRGALDNDYLCQLALGNKHTLGLDSLPQQDEQAYVYYKNAAEGTKRERELHRDTDVYPEMVRLTDEMILGEQTSEDGQLFLWFKHQAAQGVVSAQRQLARLLYWGTQGVKRNPRAAAQFYHMSAQSEDPVALYDYGLVRLIGQGVQQNVDEGLKWLQKSADKGYDEAINTLGWYALTREENMTKAAALFEAAYRLGNKDAAHSLGHMYMDGRYPGSGPDKLRALDYFVYAATRQHQASGILLAMYSMRGHPNLERDPHNAVEWARYISEQHPALANVLSQGVKAYINHDWASSFLYYMIAANTGIEIANFNLAYLCDENKDGLAAYVEKECVWKHYNLSTIGHKNGVDPYAWIKMGDYFWYGCGKQRNPSRAAEMYANAAQRGDPHAIFNLAYLVQESVKVADDIWDKLAIPTAVRTSNDSLLIELYSRCRNSPHTEAHMACTLALYKMYAMAIWQKYHILLTVSSALGAIAGTFLTSMAVYTHLRQRRQVNTV